MITSFIAKRRAIKITRFQKVRVKHTPDRVEDVHKKKVDSLLEDQLKDDTMYGEIIPSLMGWLSPDEQKERTDKLEELSREMAEKKDEMDE